MTQEEMAERIQSHEQRISKLERIILAMLEEQEDEAPEPTTYLDGTPIT